MSIFEAIILGIVQGLTEFIPVSSSGHLLIFHEILGSSDDSLAFDVALHVGTLLALILYFYKDIIDLMQNVFKDNKQGKLARILVYSTIPAAAAGLVFGGYIDDNLRTPLIVAVMLAFVGILMIVVDKITENNANNEISLKQGLTVGFAQALALIPGVSRSGITITTGLVMGMTRKQAARYSFLLAIPIIAGSAIGVLLKESNNVSIGSWQIFFGMLAAFLSGLFAIKLLLGVISKIGLTPFGIYRIIAAIIVVILLV